MNSASMPTTAMLTLCKSVNPGHYLSIAPRSQPRRAATSRAPPAPARNTLRILAFLLHRCWPLLSRCGRSDQVDGACGHDQSGRVRRWPASVAVGADVPGYVRTRRSPEPLPADDLRRTSVRFRASCECRCGTGPPARGRSACKAMATTRYEPTAEAPTYGLGIDPYGAWALSGYGRETRQPEHRSRVHSGEWNALSTRFFDDDIRCEEGA